MNTVADALVPSVAAFPANIEQFASVLETPRNSLEIFHRGSRRLGPSDATSGGFVLCGLSYIHEAIRKRSHERPHQHPGRVGSRRKQRMTATIRVASFRCVAQAVGCAFEVVASIYRIPRKPRFRKSSEPPQGLQHQIVKTHGKVIQWSHSENDQVTARILASQ